MEKISNEVIELITSKQGAEFQSIKANGIEYLWQGDPSIWKFRSPMLFPIVGFLKDNECFINGNRYEMPVNHGFGKLATYKVISLTNDSVMYELTSNEDTKKEYPFEFVLHITYRLEGNQIHVIWDVTNTGNQSMYYHIGAHTGYSFNMGGNYSIDDYYLELDEEKKLEAYDFANNKTGTLRPFTENPIKIINFKEAIKERGVCILKDVKAVTLKSDKHNHSIRIDFDSLPILGLWHPIVEHVPFVCIEPWHGIMDNKDTDKDFLKKEYLIKLEPQKSYCNGYTISVK